MVEFKKVNVKLLELREMSSALGKLLSSTMPVKQSYRMSKLAKCITKEMNDIEESRNDLIKKFGDKNDKGQIEIIDNDKKEEFNKEFADLLKEEVEITFVPIDLENIGEAKLTPFDIVALDIFLDDKSVERMLAEEDDRVERPLQR